MRGWGVLSRAFRACAMAVVLPLAACGGAGVSVQGAGMDTPTSPAVPTGLTAMAGDTLVSLAWSAVSGADAYQVKRATQSAGPFSAVATPTAAAYTDTGLTDGTAYYYVVSASNGAVSSGDSAIVNATPTRTVPAPAAPTGVQATAGNAQVVLAWSSTTGATGYQVLRGTASGGPYTQVATPAGAGYTDTGLTNGKAYYYEVVAINATGASAASAQVTATPSGTPPSTPAPAAPTGVMASAGNAQVVLSWTASTGATSYQVRRATVNGGPYAQIATSTSAGFTNTGLTNGTTYYYVIVAVSAAGSSAASAQASATPEAPAAGVPATPTGVAAAGGNAQVALTWTAVSGATGYRVKRASVSGGPYTLIAAPGAAAYTDSNLTNGTPYYYVVSATNDAGESANSVQVSATPSAGTASSPPAICPVPVTPDSSATTATVGTGTAASCTEAALQTAVARGGVIRFSCGGAATIGISSQLTVRNDVNTTIDGEGRITLDAHGATRIFLFSSPNFRATRTKFTVQNITLQNGASASFGAPVSTGGAGCSQGSNQDGGGGAIFVRDGLLNVINATFKANAGAPLGPDVGGGAIYAEGSLGVMIAGSTFQADNASNGGAVGMLQSDFSVYNSAFTSNSALGNGANYGASGSCSQTGSGGNGGAISIDGGADGTVNICGSTFTGNTGGANAFGGAIFRTPDGALQITAIDRSTFASNSANQGGALYFHNSNLTLTASTLSANTAPGNGGAIFADSSTLNFTNDTFADNISSNSLGGSIALFGMGGTLKNVTFLGNQASGGSGKFAAAIAGGTALTITNTLFSDNTTKDCGAPMACQSGNSTGSHNLQWPQTHLVCATTDSLCSTGTVFSNPQLGALQNNGGPTQTAAPLPGSPALGIGQSCPATDQRGIARPASNCSAGAVEGAVSP